MIILHKNISSIILIVLDKCIITLMLLNYSVASGVPLGEIYAGFSFSCNKKKKNETNNPQYGTKNELHCRSMKAFGSFMNLLTTYIVARGSKHVHYKDKNILLQNDVLQVYNGLLEEPIIMLL